ncbi:PQQ-binding-like beta-propeller repeat protein [candidate division KSB1 bacterium]
MKKILFCIIVIVASYSIVSAQQGELVFEYKTNGAITSCPAVGNDGTIYFLSKDGNLYALNSDGTLKWNYYVGESFRDAFSSPTIGKDGTIYFSSMNTGLHAVNPDGSLKWNTSIPGGTYISTSAVAGDGTIYLGCFSYGLYAIDSNGEIKWLFQTLGSDGVYLSSPAIGNDGTIYVGARDSSFYAINDDGTLKWRYKTGGYVDSSPSINTETETIYFGCADGYFYSLNYDGTLNWKIEIGDEITSSPSIGEDGTLYFGCVDGYLYAVDANGTLNWKFRTDGNIDLCSPLVGSDGTLYICAGDFNIYAIDSMGALKWRYNTGAGVTNSSPSIGQDGHIYIGSENGYFSAIENDIYSQQANSPWPKFHGDNRNTGNNRKLFTKPDIVEINNVLLNKTGIGSFVIRNNNPESISVDSIVSDNEYFSIYPISGEIPPDDSLIINIQFTPTDLYDQNGLITVYSRGSNNSLFLRVMGTASSPQIALSTDWVNLGYVPVYETGYGSFLINNNGNEDLIISQISLDDSAFSIEPTSLTILPGDSDSVFVTFTPSEEGIFSSTITIVSNDSIQSICTIPVEGEGYIPDSADVPVYYTVTIDDISNKMAHISGIVQLDRLSELDSLTFYLKNFHVSNLKFIDENGNILDYVNWDENFMNYFTVKHKKSREIRIIYDMKMEYIITFEEYPLHAGFEDCLINENIGYASTWYHLIMCSQDIWSYTSNQYIDVKFQLVSNWTVISSVENNNGYNRYRIHDSETGNTIIFGEFKFKEQTFNETDLKLIFHVYNDYVPEIKTDYIYSLVEYVTNWLGAHPNNRINPRTFAPFYNPLLPESKYPIGMGGYYYLNSFTGFAHYLMVDFIPDVIPGCEYWFGEGGTGAFYQFALPYASENTSLRHFYQGLLTCKWNYENIIFGNSNEVSLHDAEPLIYIDSELYFLLCQNKGTLVMFLIDRLMREMTSGVKNIDDFTKYIFDTYADQSTIYFTDSEMLNALNTLTGSDFTDFFNRYVYGTEKLPLDEYFMDNDSDSLLNYLEDDLGTNRNSADSDGDGINDALESFYYFTDPMNPNSYTNLTLNTNEVGGNRDITMENIQTEESNAQIIIDGNGDDWALISPIVIDSLLDNGGFEYEDADIKNVKLLINNGMLYLYVDFHAGHKRTIAYDILMDVKPNSGPTEFDYLIRDEMMGNTFLWDVSLILPKNVMYNIGSAINRPIGIKEIKGSCEDVLEISFPLDLIDIDSDEITFEIRTVNAIQVATINSRGPEQQKYMPYLVGDTAEFSVNVVTGIADKETIIPKDFRLFSNFPNPFNPSTTIQYSLPRTTIVTVKVYDILGREVETLLSQQMPAGSHSIVWDGTDYSGNQVSTGIYIYRIQAGEYTAARKMILLK